MAFTKSKKSQPKALKKPPIPRRVPIAKGDPRSATAAPGGDPASSKLLKAARLEIAGRIERLECEERGERGEVAHEATPGGTAATTAHGATSGPAANDGVPGADAAHGGTSPESGVPAKPAKNGKSPKAEKTPKAPKPAKEPKPKRVSALDAAATVLREEAKPMRAVELIQQMEAKGLWKSPGGKTPASTLYAAMVREINTKGDASRFRKGEKGLFLAARV